MAPLVSFALASATIERLASSIAATRKAMCWLTAMCWLAAMKVADCAAPRLARAHLRLEHLAVGYFAARLRG